jgi:hypothetical protein
MRQIGRMVGDLVVIETDGAGDMARGIFLIGIALLRRQVIGSIDDVAANRPIR